MSVRENDVTKQRNHAAALDSKSDRLSYGALVTLPSTRRIGISPRNQRQNGSIRARKHWTRVPLKSAPTISTMNLGNQSPCNSANFISRLVTMSHPLALARRVWTMAYELRQQVEHSCRTKRLLRFCRDLQQEVKRHSRTNKPPSTWNGYRDTHGCIERTKSPPQDSTLQFPVDRGAIRSSETLDQIFYNTLFWKPLSWHAAITVLILIH